jgi:hypothetical protein
MRPVGAPWVLPGWPERGRGRGGKGAGLWETEGVDSHQLQHLHRDSFENTKLSWREKKVNA